LVFRKANVPFQRGRSAGFGLNINGILTIVITLKIDAVQQKVTLNLARVGGYKRFAIRCFDYRSALE
jgi:hypothetical protein